MPIKNFEKVTLKELEIALEDEKRHGAWLKTESEAIERMTAEMRRRIDAVCERGEPNDLHDRIEELAVLARQVHKAAMERQRVARRWMLVLGIGLGLVGGIVWWLWG